MCYILDFQDIYIEGRTVPTHPAQQSQTPVDVAALRYVVANQTKLNESLEAQKVVLNEDIEVLKRLVNSGYKNTPLETIKDNNPEALDLLERLVNSEYKNTPLETIKDKKTKALDLLKRKYETRKLEINRATKDIGALKSMHQP